MGCTKKDKLVIRMHVPSDRRRGAIIVEYALVMGVVVVQLVLLCSPGGPVFGLIRDIYRRMVFVISLPWL